ncbi:MAG TPA: Flp family type IVb pilin [Sphingomonas sp.]|jgi:pilus assembly protein Flp/PilA|uniref:Flp family type IVb pilin n=1 Tax=Sphingomonas sp. TaxID=28214 RepID=UPI002ED8AA07
MPFKTPLTLLRYRYAMPDGSAGAIMRDVGDLLRNQSGATAIEYGLILALIVLIVVVGIRGVAGVTIDMWNDVAAKVTNA